MANAAPEWVTNWTVTRNELKEGENTVNFEALAQALRGDVAVPREVRDYLATLFERGRVKKPRGHPVKGNWLERMAERELVVSTYRFQYWLARANKKREDKGGSPTEIAYAETCHALAKGGLHMEEDNVKRIVRQYGAEPWDPDEDPFWDPPADHR